MALTVCIRRPEVIDGVPDLLYPLLSPSELCPTQACWVDDCRERLLGRCYECVAIRGSMLSLQSEREKARDEDKVRTEHRWGGVSRRAAA